MLPRCPPRSSFSDHSARAARPKKHHGLGSSLCLSILPVCSCESWACLVNLCCVQGHYRHYSSDDTSYEATRQPGKAKHRGVHRNSSILFVALLVAWTSAAGFSDGGFSHRPSKIGKQQMRPPAERHERGQECGRRATAQNHPDTTLLEVVSPNSTFPYCAPRNRHT